MSCRDRCLKELSTLMVTLDQFKVTKDKVARQSRKCCFKRQTGRVTKGPTRHSFFFFTFGYSSRVLFGKQKNRATSRCEGRRTPTERPQRDLAPSFCSFLSPPQWACPMQIRASQGRGTVFHLTSQLLKYTCGFFKSEISLKLQFTVWIECDS